MDEDLAWSGWKEGRTEGREGGRQIGVVFPFDISQILPVRICATDMTVLLETHEFVCVHLH